MTSRFSFAASAALLALWLCGPVQALAQPGRYLYALGCDARVDKLDTMQGRVTKTVDLAKSAGVESGPGAIDGCLAEQLVYDAAHARAFVLMPRTSRTEADGTRDYRVVVFSVPDWKIERTLPAGNAQADAPRLLPDAEQGVRIVAADQAPAPRATVDLQGFAGNDAPGNQILETSGSVSLLRLFTADRDRLVLAVADEHARTLQRLDNLPSTTALNAHLAPGGRYVLVEVTDTATPARRTGELDLYDAATGALHGRLAGQAAGQMAFVAIAPGGTAVYRSGSRFVVVKLGAAFGVEPVTKPLPGPGPGFFFADR
jgi:hypothetical protein